MDYRDVFKELDRIQTTKGRLTRKDIVELRKTFGKRFSEAYRLLRGRCVKKYIFKPSGRTVWVVVGNGREYMLYPMIAFCNCEDFYFSVMEGKAKACAHLISQRLAAILGMYDLIVENDELYDVLMEEWKRVGACEGES